MRRNPPPPPPQDPIEVLTGAVLLRTETIHKQRQRKAELHKLLWGDDDSEEGLAAKLERAQESVRSYEVRLRQAREEAEALAAELSKRQKEETELEASLAREELELRELLRSPNPPGGGR